MKLTQYSDWYGTYYGTENSNISQSAQINLQTHVLVAGNWFHRSVLWEILRNFKQ